MTVDTTRLTSTVAALATAIEQDHVDTDGTVVGDVVVIAELVHRDSEGRGRELRVRFPEDMRFHSRLGILDEASGMLTFQRFGPRRQPPP